MSIFKVGDGKSDVGIGAMSYNFERQTFVDYTFPTGIDGMVWVSKPPQQLPPIKNISLIFDISSWGCILLSIILVTIVLIVIIRIGSTYGGQDVKASKLFFFSLEYLTN